jgi:hypothetical protein
VTTPRDVSRAGAPPEVGTPRPAATKPATGSATGHTMSGPNARGVPYPTASGNIMNTWLWKGSVAQDMREIFISYSHLDNQPNPHITHEVTRAVDHFLAVYSHVCDVPTGGAENELFLLDQCYGKV